MKLKTFLIIILFVYACSESVQKNPPEEKREEPVEIKKYDPESYKPEQPVKFSHTTHVPEGMTCTHCHTDNTEKDTILIKKPLPSVKVKEIPDHLKKRDYRHKNPSGDMSDCSRCHY